MSPLTNDIMASIAPRPNQAHQNVYNVNAIGKSQQRLVDQQQLQQQLQVICRNTYSQPLAFSIRLFAKLIAASQYATIFAADIVKSASITKAIAHTAYGAYATISTETNKFAR